MAHRIRSWQATLAAASVALAGGVGFAATNRVGAQSGAAAAAGPVSDWRLTWSDDFSGSLLDANKWGTCFPADRWTPDNCTVDGGSNAATREPATSEGAKVEVTGGVLRLWAERRSQVSSVTGATYAFRGAMVQGRRAMSAPNSDVRLWETSPVLDEAAWGDVYVEARIKIPRGVGLWPSFWAMPADSRLGAWPYSGEIDAMEFLPDASTQGPSGDARFIQNLVWHGQIRGSDCTYPGNGYFTMCPNRVSQAGPTPWTDFHTFGYEKNRGGVTFYVDGVPVRMLPRWTSTANDLYPFDQPFFPILRLNVGAPPDYLTADTATWPVQSPVPGAFMDVDYVRVYQRLNSWVGGVAPPTTAPPATTAPPVTTAPPATTAPPTTTPPGSAACLSETFESGIGAWAAWWTGSVARRTDTVRTGGGSLALSGSPATASRVVLPGECGGRTPNRIRFWVRAADSSTSAIFIKTVDRSSGNATSGAWYPVSATDWRLFDLPLSVGPAGMLVGIDGAAVRSPGLFVDDVELFA